MRSGEQRRGDIACVLAAFAVLSLISHLLSAKEFTNFGGSFPWWFLGLGVSVALYPAFAAACLVPTIDERRQKWVGLPVALVAITCGFLSLGVLTVARNDDFGVGQSLARVIPLALGNLLLSGAAVVLVQRVILAPMRLQEEADGGDEVAE